MKKMGISFQIVLVTVLLGLFTLITVSCGPKSWTRVEEFSDDSAAASEWETATPESQGIDSGSLVKMMEALENSNQDIDAVFIVRNGYKVFEAYNKPYTSEIPHLLYSVSKSITSTLVGIAIDQGYIEGPEQPVLDLFKSKQDKLKEYISDDLKLKHLLTMSTGLKLRDNEEYQHNGIFEMFESRDFTVHSLSRDKVHEPGEYFEYSNCTSYMLASALDENTGLKTWKFADSVLFKPLGITDYKLEITKKEDIMLGYSGVWLKAEDFAKFA